MAATTTAQAAQRAGVTVATIRTWARYGAIAATKTGGRWNIDEASLTRRIALSRRTAAKQLAAFRDTTAAQAKADELIESGSLIQMNPYTFLAISSTGGSGYIVNTVEGSCTCKGHTYTGHCFHLLAAVALETAPAA
jgi:excisionase family DNA binding protein